MSELFHKQVSEGQLARDLFNIIIVLQKLGVFRLKTALTMTYPWNQCPYYQLWGYL